MICLWKHLADRKLYGSALPARSGVWLLLSAGGDPGWFLALPAALHGTALGVRDLTCRTGPGYSCQSGTDLLTSVSVASRYRPYAQ